MSCRRRTVRLTLILGAGFAMSAAGQDAQESAHPTGLEVIDRHIEATGGRAAYEGLKTRVSRGQVSMGLFGLNGKLVTYQGAPAAFRRVMEMPFGNVEVGVAGEIAWELGPEGEAIVSEGDDLQRILDDVLFPSELSYQDRFTGIECVGEASANGRPCWKVELTAAHGTTSQFFDQESGFLVREVRPNPYGSGQLVSTFDDYRGVDGILAPHSMSSMAPGFAQRIVFSEIRDNVEIPDERFVPPEAVKRLLSMTGPSAEQLAWLAEHAIPFDTVEAGNGFADLMPLKALIGEARIVALGESTHGSREFFQMKHRMVEFLATEMGFTVFSIEAAMPEAYRLNDYVHQGIGDPKLLIGGMHFWTWSTEEVLAMVQWMREFNRSKTGRIDFTGFDMQHPDIALDNVLEFLSQAETGFDPKLRERYEGLSRANAELKQARRSDADSAGGAERDEATESSAKILAHLQHNRDAYLESWPAETVDWVIQNARVVDQCTRMNAGSFLAGRDQSMAENIRWIVEQNPDARIVVWAHDSHVAQPGPAQGTGPAQGSGRLSGFRVADRGAPLPVDRCGGKGPAVRRRAPVGVVRGVDLHRADHADGAAHSLSRGGPGTAAPARPKHRKLRQVTLEQRLHEQLAPREAARLGGTEVGAWKAAAAPEVRQGIRAEFGAGRASAAPRR